jgi:hypothetical protein
MIESGNNRGHLQCGHGLPGVIKDLLKSSLVSGL